MDASVWLLRKLNVLPNRKIITNNPVIAILQNKCTLKNSKQLSIK